VETRNPPEAASQNPADAEERKKALEQRRYRLLALATELERGSVVHHRVLRVNELNYLRDQAIKELRSQAKLPSGPKTLPGPKQINGSSGRAPCESLKMRKLCRLCGRDLHASMTLLPI
jgi:hypothetical protein